MLFHRAECVLGRKERPSARAGLPVAPCVSRLDVAAGAQWLGLVLDAVVVFPLVSDQIWEFLPGKGMLRFPANKLPADQPSGAETLHLIALKPSSPLSCIQSHIGVRERLSQPVALSVLVLPSDSMWCLRSSSPEAAAGIP